MKTLARLVGVGAALALLAGCEEGDELVEGVDLKIVGLRIPSATGLQQGSSVTLTVLAKNNGTEPIAETFMTEVEFFDDAALTRRSSWTAVGAPYARGLSSGEIVALELATTVDASAPPQLVFCRATCDSGGAITEDNEGNNSYVKACQVLPGGADGGEEESPDMPDLVVSSLTVPGEIERGGDLAVSLTARNRGGVAAEVPFTVNVTVYEDESYLNVLWPSWETVHEEGLAPGAETGSFDLSFTSRPTDPLGTVYVVAIADSLGEVDEGDEDNNEATAQAEIKLPGDGTVPTEGIDLEIGSMNVPAEAYPGKTVDISVTVRNVGDETVQPANPTTVTVTVYKNTSYSEENELWSPQEQTRDVEIAPTATKSFQFSFSVDPADPTGLAYIVATVKTAGDVAPGNDSATDDFTIANPPPPDLIVSSVASADTYKSGDGGGILVTFKVSNIGQGDADGSVACVWISPATEGFTNATYLGLEPVEALPAGKTCEAPHTVSFAYDATVEGKHNVYVQADGLDTETEKDESNNVSFSNTTIYFSD